MTASIYDLTATEIAARVNDGSLDPTEVATRALARIEAVDRRLGAFVERRGTAALEEATGLAGREDLGELPLAGVPVAVKDMEDVAGLPTRRGSDATADDPASSDSPVVARLRAAGAIVVGKTRLPELEIWPTSDDSGGIARNPWDPSRSAGGSSGGSATAVAAGMVPLALAADGAGSVRIPAASCGLFGIKPGRGVAPQLEPNGDVHWFGMSHFGPLATTVADAALMLDVLVGSTRFREPSSPDGALRIAVSARATTPLGLVDRRWRDAVVATARVLHRAGHELVAASPPYELRDALAATSRWLQGPSRDFEQYVVAPDRLQARTRTHLRMGERFDRLVPIQAEQQQAWRDRALRFFDDHDLLITPTLAAPPLSAEPWRQRPWAANLAGSMPQAEFTIIWNLADLPAASVPAGLDEEGRPLAVQIVGPEGGEELVLSLARHLEELAPWLRHAPTGADVSRTAPAVR